MQRHREGAIGAGGVPGGGLGGIGGIGGISPLRSGHAGAFAEQAAQLPLATGIRQLDLGAQHEH